MGPVSKATKKARVIFLKGSPIKDCVIDAHKTSRMQKVSHTHEVTRMLVENVTIMRKVLFCNMCNLCVEVIAIRYHAGLQFKAIKPDLGAV